MKTRQDKIKTKTQKAGKIKQRAESNEQKRKRTSHKIKDFFPTTKVEHNLGAHKVPKPIGCHDNNFILFVFVLTSG
jgi:hypothetical protein